MHVRNNLVNNKRKLNRNRTDEFLLVLECTITFGNMYERNDESSALMVDGGDKLDLMIKVCLGFN